MNVCARLERLARDVVDQYEDRALEQELRGIRQWMETHGFDGDLARHEPPDAEEVPK